MLGLVWAQSREGVIGVGGDLPWDLPEDRAHFRAVTDGHPVVMGRATWDSLPARFRPLPGRENVVLSRRPDLVLEGATVVPGVEGALEVVADRDAWVIGGAAVYAAFLDRADRIEVTDVDVTVTGDTWAPRPDPADWSEVAREPVDGWATSRTGLRYRFRSLRRVGSEVWPAGPGATRGR